MQSHKNITGGQRVKMNTVNNLVRTAILVLLVTAFAVLFAITPTRAQEESQESIEEVQSEEVQTTEEQTEQNGVVYTFTAQSGDSYTEIARKVTQIYGIETETNLSGEQIVYVETHLTKAAGSPALNIGQEVTFSQSLVQEWVDSAVNLSEGELSLWTKYANTVDFNTDAVGEPAA